MAGFFTEVVLDESRSPVVFDDPMTSLDHVRRARVAARVVELARDRQVVVFTHDASFALDVRKEAASADVAVQERFVQREAGGAGTCSNEHPWQAKDTKARLQGLEAHLARLERESGEGDEDGYDKQVIDFAGKLSEAWERLIRLDIANELVDPVQMEVRPAKFLLLAKVTEADVEEFQQPTGVVRAGRVAMTSLRSSTTSHPQWRSCERSCNAPEIGTPGWEGISGDVRWITGR